MEFNNNSPIYTQIVEFFKSKIASGGYAPGDRVESVRELSLSMEVNPNTMQRAMSELERDGYLYSERTSGRYITKNTELIDSLKYGLIENILDNFINEMSAIGIKKNEIIRLLQKKLDEKE